MGEPDVSLQEKASRIREELTRLKQVGITAKATAGPSLVQSLQASERLLFGELNKQGVLKESPPQTDLGGGNIEFGLTLFWVFNPPKNSRYLFDAMKEYLEWQTGGALKATQPDDYSAIQDQIARGDKVMPDGSIFGSGKYEMADIGWAEYLIYLIYFDLFPDERAPFNDVPADIIDLAATTSQNEVSIAILGDWGIGNYTSDGGPAKAVMGAISNSPAIGDPDYIIHLGDVYYAGTETSEEYDKLVQVWPKDRFSNGSKAGTSFTLNSNHEMYGGANGYFKVALSGADTPFDKQQKASFFALKFGDWMLLGLDSAYYSPSSTFYMYGSLGGSASSVQKDWLRKVAGSRNGKDVILLSHHNPISFDGITQQELWHEAVDALGGTPDYWYWGHIHLGVVYGNSLPAAQVPDGRFAKVRCSGNAAIPNGAPPGLEGKPNIEYYCQTPLQNKEPRVRNGFALIKLTKDGQITETFYEVADGSTEPVEVWKSPVEQVT